LLNDIAQKIIKIDICPFYTGIVAGFTMNFFRVCRKALPSTQRPEFNQAVVCQVPPPDMQRYDKLLAGASTNEQTAKFTALQYSYLWMKLR
jgi:hypothetical protein